ncbi:flagellar hook-length control protein FliK [Jiella sp. M17.18]|uniref:flagellar hook-length control protein FliK n=1 Tax=Jiella sp. M17.18 TaxID=3234247 RepID=UPI0034DEAE08
MSALASLLADVGERLHDGGRIDERQRAGAEDGKNVPADATSQQAPDAHGDDGRPHRTTASAATAMGMTGRISKGTVEPGSGPASAVSSKADYATIADAQPDADAVQLALLSGAAAAVQPQPAFAGVQGVNATAPAATSQDDHLSKGMADTASPGKADGVSAAIDHAGSAGPHDGSSMPAFPAVGRGAAEATIGSLATGAAAASSVSRFVRGIGGDAGPQSAIAARADFVSMRTDFEPAGRRVTRPDAASAETARATVSRSPGQGPANALAGQLAGAGNADHGGRQPAPIPNVGGTPSSQKGATLPQPMGANGAISGAQTLTPSHVPSARRGSASAVRGSDADRSASQSAGTGQVVTSVPSAAMAMAAVPTSDRDPGSRSAERRAAADDLQVADDPKTDALGNDADVRTDNRAAVLGGSSAATLAAAGSPTRQVASAVTQVLPHLVPPGSAQAAAEDRTRLRAGGAALKTIQIQLQPEQFGKVDVTMRLVEGHLQVHLEASEPDTVLKLKDDTEGLKKLLGKAGFSLDDAAISIGIRDPNAARQNSAAPMPQPNGGAGGGAQRNDAGASAGQNWSAQSGQGGSRGGDGRRAPAGGGAVSPERVEPSRRRSDLDPSVYV